MIYIFVHANRVVTSVSVVMNGKEPQFADAVGNYIPRPLVPPRVASPVSLLGKILQVDSKPFKILTIAIIFLNKNLFYELKSIKFLLI